MNAAPLLRLAAGRPIYAGSEVKISGERGRFRVDGVAVSDGSLICYGPLDNGRARSRSFTPARVVTIHRKPKEHRTP